MGWIKTIKKSPRQTKKTKPTTKSQMLIYPRLCANTVGLLIPVKPRACSMTAIFTETQLDGADSATIDELEEPGCCARQVAATYLDYEIPKPLFCPRGIWTHTTNTPLSPENRLVPCTVSCHQLRTRIAQGCCLPPELGRLSWRLTASSKPLQGCRPAGSLRVCWSYSTTHNLLQESWQDGGKQEV